MKTGQIRQIFLEYFRTRDHVVVPSSALVPSNDPTLLFTNAGMVQFKDTFLGLEKRPYTRAASSQRCVRAGGKHNDLENVGFTARHHTFFEMLGNFSFGDYFKREAIQFAWDFLTKVLKLPPERLWVTVYEKDEEAADIWLNDMKIDPARFSRCGEKDNFWSMGETGPCGPCSEIFYDHGASVPGGPPGSPDQEGDRYVEIWNLVFMQYSRGVDGLLTPLPKPSVDTGMGLERIAAVMQGVKSNYEIDLFQKLISFIAYLAGFKDLAERSVAEQKSMRVIADHIRSCSFLIADGVIPSNEGRGYVLRRICRRAIRHGHRLGFQAPFFYQLVAPLAEEMGDVYPELNEKRQTIERILQQEELQFERTLEQGLRILEQDMNAMTDATISGATVFRLYDTYGFPVDLTADIARERNLTIDMEGFREAMELQRTRARGSSQFSIQVNDRIDIPHSTDFTGYLLLEEEAKVLALFSETQSEITELKKGEKGSVVIDHTPFYAEAGGQVGDQGVLYFSEGEFEVHNTKKLGQAFLHYGQVKHGTLVLNAIVRASVDKKKRGATALNHSATHLLHSALRKILGTHVEQKGSLVDPDRLRFDFSHFEALTLKQIREIESLVNEQIRLNSDVVTELMPVDKALESGAMALFGEKYDRDKQVRVLTMGGNFSIELCGGTHVKKTGDIGFFKITTETGIAAGVRRLEAVTGASAVLFVDKLQAKIDNIATLLKCNPEEAPEKVQQLLTKSKQFEKELQQLKVKMLNGVAGNDFEFQEFGNIKVLAQEIKESDPKTLRAIIDKLKDQHKTAVIVLGSVQEQKVTLIVGVTQNCIDQYQIRAGELVGDIARYVGGQGGGRADMAQAGGNNPAGLKEALEAVVKFVQDRAFTAKETTQKNHNP